MRVWFVILRLFHIRPSNTQRRRHRRIAVQYQTTSTDCGPACLAMLASVHGRRIDYGTLRDLCQADRQGSSLAAMTAAASQIGLITQSGRISFDGLIALKELPCIAYWPQGHFILLTHVNKDRVRFIDPAIGRFSMSRSDFEHCWYQVDRSPKRGVLLTVTGVQSVNCLPAIGTVPREVPGLWQTIRGELDKAKYAFASLLIGSLVFQLLIPWASFRFFSKGVIERNPHVLLVLGLGQFAFMTGRWVLECFQSFVVARMALVVDEVETQRLLKKLVSLPIRFLETIQMGDIIQRIQDQSLAISLVTDGLSQAVFALIASSVLSLALAVYNVELLAYFFACASITVAASFYAGQFLKAAKYRLLRLSASQQNELVEFLEGLVDIKVHGASTPRLEAFSAVQSRLHKTALYSRTAESLKHVMTSVLIEGSSLLLSVIASHLILDGSMTVGALLAIQYLLGQIFSPLSQLSTLMGHVPDIHISNLRVNELYAVKSDLEGQAPSATSAGSIQVDNLSFAYRGTTPRKVLEEVSLCIKEHSLTAIIGTSGCGKSTLLKLLLLVYDPDSGRILVGDTDLAIMSPDEWRRTCGVVLQDGFIFSTTILENIAIGDQNPDKERVEWAADVACIRDFIHDLPLGYNTKIGAAGVSLSKGQIQRILLSRALYKRPRYLFLDEATSAVDAATEARIISNLRGACTETTVVAVAHRASSVIGADEILVLDGGRVQEQGRHDDLLRRNGFYSNFISQQLIHAAEGV
jgi:ATP-binding cassette, subfamily B, bacterial